MVLAAAFGMLACGQHAHGDDPSHQDEPPRHRDTKQDPSRADRLVGNLEAFFTRSRHVCLTIRCGSLRLVGRERISRWDL